MANIPERIRNLRGNDPDPISVLAEYASTPLAIGLLLSFFVRVILERYILPYVHDNKYKMLTDWDRRGFVQNYLHLIGRALILGFAVWPLAEILGGRGNFHTKYAGTVTYGDVELVAMQLVIALYFHEILYKINVSAVTLLHHVGAIAVGTYAIVMAANYSHHDIAHAYFCMATIWGIFDVFTEAAVATALITYRLNKRRPDIRMWACGLAAGAQLVSICVESGFVFWIITAPPLWNGVWDVTFKVLTPLLHVIFTAGQLWCAYSLVGITRRCRRDYRTQNADVELEEGNAGVVVVNEPAKQDSAYSPSTSSADADVSQPPLVTVR